MNIKKMRMQLIATAASVLISGIALTSATYAWYVANNTVEAVTTNISATTNGFILQIATAKQGPQHGGEQTSLAASTEGGKISPSSTNDLKTWYVNQGINGEGKVASYIINFQNGILRLADMALLPHSPEVLSTIQIPCEWHDSPTPTPVYDAYLSRLVNYDAEMENLCNEINGVVISNVNCSRMKKSVFFVGDGSTGKSQLKSLVEHLLGPDNYIGIDLKDIEARFGTGAIYGTRLAGSSDMSFVSIGELKTFKSLTGGDSVFAEFKGQQPFKFFYKGFLWFCMVSPQN